MVNAFAFLVYIYGLPFSTVLDRNRIVSFLTSAGMV